MRLPRPARVPRSGREPRAAREPRSAPRSVLPAPSSEIPAVGTLWHQLDERGGVLLHGNGEPQLFQVVEVRSANGFRFVAYLLIGTIATRRMGLAAFRNRFTPAP